MKPSIGRTVHFVLSAGPNAGQSRAAVITLVQENGNVCLTCFPVVKQDKLGSTLSLENVAYSETNGNGTWHWPPRDE